MSLHMVWGASGSGKSTYVFDEMIAQAAKRRDDYFLVLVPDQFSQEAQRILVEKSGGAIINIDVLSFHRLAYRAFEEARAQERIVLADEGKMMLLRKVISEHRGELNYFTKGLDSQGFLDECKSLLSEFIEYGVGDEEFDKLCEEVGADTKLGLKIRDIQLLYESMTEKMGETYRMAEEMIPVLTSLVPSLSFLDNATICLDGFTGFTPVQYDLLGELMKRSRDVYITVTTDRGYTGAGAPREDVFSLSTETINKLTITATNYGVEVADPVVVGAGEDNGSYRLCDNPIIDHLEKNIFKEIQDKDITDNKPGQTDGIHIRACRRIEDEAGFVARQIRSLVRDGATYGSIAVVSGAPDTYEPYLRAVFDKLHIRYFSDKKKSLGTNPLAEYISGYLYACIYGFDTEHMVRLLRCRLSPLEPTQTDVLENYIIASGRRGIRSYEAEWTYEVNDIRMPLELVNSYRETVVQSFSETYTALQGGKKSIKNFTEIIYNLLVKNNIYNTLSDMSEEYEKQGDIVLAKEYKKLYSGVIKIFDDLVDLLGDEEVSLKEYTEILLSGISQGMLGFVPPSKDAVLIGDVERSRLSEVDYIFILGNNDDIFPKGNSAKGILTQAERMLIESTGIELAPSADKLYERELFYMYMLLSKSRRGLYLTYAKARANGEAKRPSYLIEKIREVYGGEYPAVEDDEKDISEEAALGVDSGRRYLLRGIYSEADEDMWREIANYYREVDEAFFNRISHRITVDKRSAHISSQTAEALYGRDIYASVTRLENFVNCPYAHYLGYGLRLMDREKYTPDPRDRGNIFHDALESLTHTLMEQGRSWQSVEEDEIDELTESSLKKAISGYRDDIYFQDKRTSYITKKITRIYRKSIHHLVNQMKVGRFVQTGSELGFPDDGAGDEMTFMLSGDHKLQLHGRIDRIDTYEDDQARYIKIIDYKSSSRSLSLGDVYHGLQLQLFTYLMAATSLDNTKQNIPAATLYFAVDEDEQNWTDKLVTSEAIEDADKLNFRPQGYVNSDQDIYTLLDDSLADGGVKSYAVPVVTTKSGKPHASQSKTLSTEEFEKLKIHTRDNIIQDGEAIYSGEIYARPAEHKNHSGCDFCPYAGVCGIESRALAAVNRKFETLSDREVLEALGDE